MVWFRCERCGEWLEVSAGYARKSASDGGFDRVHKIRAHRDHWPQFVHCGGKMVEQSEEARARFCVQWARLHPVKRVELEPPQRMTIRGAVEKTLASMDCRTEAQQAAGW